MPLFLVDFHDPKTNSPMPMCPRGLLKRITKMAKEEFGVLANVGIEYEFFNFSGKVLAFSIYHVVVFDADRLTRNSYRNPLHSCGETRFTFNKAYTGDVWVQCHATRAQ
jgi:glutamine synthetase